MDLQKFTQKSVEALQDAKRLAEDNGNQELRQEHLLAALLEDGLIPELMDKCGARGLREAAANAVNSLPTVGGVSSGVFMSSELDRALSEAEKAAGQMSDEYVSVEHLMLGMLRRPSRSVSELFRRAGLTEDAFLKAVREVRGSGRVTSDNPEDTYDALKKYGTDLVARAREGKLDPVIGRDE
ncbi:MAG: type VI secretion system ATPase TssH, partial [Oscillospiraceae bacterium]|nr:type VI secretion system ATPase TssH [Oscillospiraceae bacterium]